MHNLHSCILDNNCVDSIKKCYKPLHTAMDAVSGKGISPMGGT